MAFAGDAEGDSAFVAFSADPSVDQAISKQSPYTLISHRNSHSSGALISGKPLPSMCDKAPRISLLSLLYPTYSLARKAPAFHKTFPKRKWYLFSRLSHSTSSADSVPCVISRNSTRGKEKRSH